MMTVVMGVAGSGKTSVGEALARRLGWAFIEGDALHPEANRRKMAAGTPLADEDRWPWLDRVAAEMCRSDATGLSAVVACSSLKRAYRDRLRRGARRVVFVHLTGERRLLEARLGARRGHFMPPALLDSQLDTLEPPEEDEHAIEVDIAAPIDVIVEAIVAALHVRDGA